MAEREASNGSPPLENKPPYGEKEVGNRNIVMRIVDSFKRDPARDPTPRGSVGEDGRVFDIESAAAATAMSPLARRLKGRHLQMIAIGGSIGECTLRYRCELKGCRDLNRLTYRLCRYWSLRRLWFGFSKWRASLSADCLCSDRYHVVLHRSRPWGNGSSLSRCRFVRGLLNSVPRSCLGFCYGMEVCLLSAALVYACFPCFFGKVLM
jgi:hypothetical protein